VGEGGGQARKGLGEGEACRVTGKEGCSYIKVLEKYCCSTSFTLYVYKIFASF
jgi:hypothetical protein